MTADSFGRTRALDETRQVQIVQNRTENGTELAEPDPTEAASDE